MATPSVTPPPPPEATLLAEALRRAPQGVLLLDAAGRITWVNDAWVAMCGFAREAMLGRVPGEFCDGPGTDPASVARIREGLASGEAFAVELLSYRADGGTYWSNVRWAPLDSGGFVCTATDVSARRHAEDLLREVVDAIPAAVLAFDAEDRLILANSTNASMFGTSRADLGQRLDTLLARLARRGMMSDASGEPAETPEAAARRYAAALREGLPQRRRRLPDGRVLHLQEAVTPSGTLVAIRLDVTALESERAARERAESLLREVLDAVPVGVFAFDAEERLVFANAAHLGVVRGADAWRPGARLEDLIRLGLARGGFPEAGEAEAKRARFAEAHLARMRAGDGVARLRRLADGRVLQLRDTRAPSGTLVCVRTDVTELDRAQAELRERAERCELTGLANRAALIERLGAEAARGQGALLLFDLDHFKQVNDTLGHAAGDALLAAVAERLRGVVRGSDLPARLGGDEFAVVMPGLAGEPAVEARMAAVQAALSRPLELGGRRLDVSLSAGLAAWPADGANAASLLKHADLALYESKRGGRGRWSLFRPEQAAAAERRASLAGALRAALAGEGEPVRVALQPKRGIGGGHEGFEALARWREVPPMEFVAAAEEAGLGCELGRAVLGRALSAARALRDLGLDPGPIAVNAGAAQLRDPGFPAEVAAQLARHGLEPADLEIEVTEGVVLGRGGDRAEAALAELRAMGVALALDDFGTGFASLSHLARLPIDRLKVDRSFVAGVGSGRPGGERGEAITRAVIGLARALGLGTVAEGVETADQLAFLDAEGCDVAQGWLIGRPLDGVEAAAAYLRGLAGNGRVLRRAGARRRFTGR